MELCIQFYSGGGGSYRLKCEQKTVINGYLGESGVWIMENYFLFPFMLLEYFKDINIEFVMT